MHPSFPKIFEAILLRPSDSLGTCKRSNWTRDSTTQFNFFAHESWNRCFSGWFFVYNTHIQVIYEFLNQKDVFSACARTNWSDASVMSGSQLQRGEFNLSFLDLYPWKKKEARFFTIQNTFQLDYNLGVKTEDQTLTCVAALPDHNGFQSSFEGDTRAVCHCVSDVLCNGRNISVQSLNKNWNTIF